MSLWSQCAPSVLAVGSCIKIGQKGRLERPLVVPQGKLKVRRNEAGAGFYSRSIAQHYATAAHGCARVSNAREQSDGLM